MRVLITNDDGILAPGIAALVGALTPLAHVDVVAPETSQSASGHAISVRTPMTVQRVHVNDQFHGWSVDGRPADCVKLAMVELLEQRPDFVLSGINAGANTGINVLYSGTVAGAVEGAFFGIPSLAFSLELSAELDFHRAGQIARAIFKRFAAANPPPATCLNVNIPALDAGWPRGVRCCPQGTTPWAEHYRRQPAPDGRAVYWLEGYMPDPRLTDDNDQAAVANRYVAITPLRFDLTDHATLRNVANWPWPQSFHSNPPATD
jgi:5'-nucleotidase